MAEPPTEAERSQEVERIRDIIFGNNMRDYDLRFRSLQQDVDQLREALDTLRQHLAEAEGGLGKRLQALRDETREADDALRQELRETAESLRRDKADRNELAGWLEQLAAQLRSAAGPAEPEAPPAAPVRAPKRGDGRD